MDKEGRLSALKEPFKEALVTGRLHQIAVDGPDGSGKGTASGRMAEILAADGYEVVRVPYPQYDAPFGQALKGLLYGESAYLILKGFDLDNEPVLTLEERMAVYALNRLEAVIPLLETMSAVMESSDRPIYIIYDRFITSNVMTLAYYLHDGRTVLKPYYSSLDDFYNGLWEMEADLIDLLGLDEVMVYVPLLRVDDIMAALEADATRKGLDSYEQMGVQELSLKLYHDIWVMRGRNLQTFTPYMGDSRIPADDVAKSVLGLAGYSGARPSEAQTKISDTPGRVHVLKSQADCEKPVDAMEKILEKYPRLRRLVN